MGNQLTKNSESYEVDEDEEEETSFWRKYLFKCFEKRPTVDYGFFDLNEYDYVVEKLAIKYVPVSIFATAYDNYEYSRNNQSQNTSTVLSASVQVSPILPTNISKPENLSKTTRKLRFSKRNSGGGIKNDSIRKPSLAHSIGGTSPAAELMSSLTAFHPHLKESDRPPKDPTSLNTIKYHRSFAEELSELAARKNNNNNTVTESSALSSIPGTSKQL